MNIRYRSRSNLKRNEENRILRKKERNLPCWIERYSLLPEVTLPRVHLLVASLYSPTAFSSSLRYEKLSTRTVR